MTTKKSMIAAGMVGGLALAVVGGVAGWMLAPREVAEASAVGTSTAPCNLGLAWNDDTKKFDTWYSRDQYVTELDYGRIANQSCEDGHILLWQQARNAQKLDARVCRPIVQYDSLGNILFVGCTDPSLAVTHEPR